ncbi:MAG: hypothetical protein AUK44_08520 [Porphyromonadaceae bacterium CG2_30_38_12]|nr:MAG: hypothetical protein AUK44_08520 [Porphyromonadaceae bacterium CG2_30_38_12]
MIYLIVLSVAVVLYLILKVISLLPNLIKTKRKFSSFFLRIFHVVQLLLWVAYAFWGFVQLFSEMVVFPFLIASLIALMVALLGWYFVRDFVVGTILKFENAFEVGQQIRTVQGSGIIKKLGYRSMQLMNAEGELEHIPYTLIAHQKISKPAETNHWVEHTLNLKIDSSLTPEKLQNELRIRLLEMPWVLSDQSLKITTTRCENDLYNVQIRLHLLSDEMIIKTQNNMQVYVSESFGHTKKI